jgi:hypothetical protein
MKKKMKAYQVDDFSLSPEKYRLFRGQGERILECYALVKHCMAILLPLSAIAAGRENAGNGVWLGPATIWQGTIFEAALAGNINTDLPGKLWRLFPRTSTQAWTESIS